MRPTIPDELAKDVERLVDEVSVVDVDHVGFEAQLKILLANVSEIEGRDSRNATPDTTEPIHVKYR